MGGVGAIAMFDSIEGRGSGAGGKTNFSLLGMTVWLKRYRKEGRGRAQAHRYVLVWLPRWGAAVLRPNKELV
jgi:hypothetical protein